jgi:hypothetical protein
VGRARPPTFADYPHLPYIRAMVMEALRWRTSVPMAVHGSTEDNWYEGMYIPKGTVCIANVWHMNHDPEIYGENAMDFDPARHLDANGDIPSGLSDNKEGHSSYGFGRRNCAGRHMANNSLFINIAVLLWATKIERKKDASGQFVSLDGFVDRGTVVLAYSPFLSEFDVNLDYSPGVRLPSSAMLLRDSQRPQLYLNRSVSCEGCEDAFIVEITQKILSRRLRLQCSELCSVRLRRHPWRADTTIVTVQWRHTSFLIALIARPGSSADTDRTPLLC